MKIEPSQTIGLGIGELACAYTVGALTSSEAMLAAYWLGYCIEEVKLPKLATVKVGR